MVSAAATKRCVAICDVAGGEHWHVVGKVRDRGGQSEPGLHAVSVGNVHPDEVGLGYVSGYIWIVLYAVLPFIRFLPMISIVEVRSLVLETDEEEHIEQQGRR